MKLSIVIVNYNVKHYLEQCLLSVERALVGLSAEVWVVDNNSSDDSVNYLKGKFPWVYFIENDTNVGFSRANNQAIVRSRGEYIMLLNPDTIVTEHTFSDCISFLDSHPDAGGLGVHMIRSDGSFALESRRGIPTPWTAFCKLTGLCSRFPKSTLFGRYYMQYLPIGRASQIEVMSGACMTLRREALAKCGILDETFFMYGEDIDISYRILKSGYKNYYLPTTILHYKGESTQKSSYRYAITFHRAMRIFFRKHFHKNFIILMMVSLAIYLKAFITFVNQQMQKKKARKETSIYNLRQKKFLLVGRGYNLEQMEKLMEKHKLYHSVADGVPDKSDSTADFVVFDTDAYTFDEVLSWYQHDDKMRTQPQIATYISLSKSIITINSIIN